MSDNDNDAPRGAAQKRGKRTHHHAFPVGSMVVPKGRPKPSSVAQHNTKVSWLIVINGLWPDPSVMALEQSPEEQVDAAHECKHGRLPHDRSAPCGCWAGEVVKTPIPLTTERELATPCPTGKGRAIVAAASTSSGPASRTVASAGSAPSEAAPRQIGKSAPGSTPAPSTPSGSTAAPRSAPRSGRGSGPSVTPTPTVGAGA